METQLVKRTEKGIATTGGGVVLPAIIADAGEKAGKRFTALTTAREHGSNIIDLQDFAGHADPRTTLTYIRSRDRLSKSPAYVLRYQ